MEVGGEGGGLYTYRNNVTTRMTSALRWAAMRAILMFHNCEGRSHKTVSTDHNFWRETWAEADSNRSPSAYQPNALLLGQTGSLTTHKRVIYYYMCALYSHGMQLFRLSLSLTLPLPLSPTPHLSTPPHPQSKPTIEHNLIHSLNYLWLFECLESHHCL